MNFWNYIWRQFILLWISFQDNIGGIIKYLLQKESMGSDEVRNPGASLSLQLCLSCPRWMQPIGIFQLSGWRVFTIPMATHLLNYYCCESLCCEWIIIHFPAEMMMCSGPGWISVSPKLLFLPWEGPWGQWEGGGNLATGSGREKKWGGLQKERPWKCVAGRMAANLQMALGLTHEMRCPGGVHSGLALRPCSVVQNWHSS